MSEDTARTGTGCLPEAHTPYKSSSRRIAKNTLMLYFRQILIMLVSLYTVRVVLAELGAEDYGIYNVVAGVVTMFGFLSGAMATASQRYFSFDMGRGDAEHLRTTFSVTCQIYFLLALVIVLLAETVGLWFVNNRLVIPAERMRAANVIYQAAVVSFVLSLLTTPFMADIIAHEDMRFYAYAGMLEVFLKLGIAFLLRLLSFDKLSLYGILLAFVAFINAAIYRIYCRIKYEECRFRFIRDGALFKEIVGYSGWNLFGSAVGVANNQLINILLNLFFNPLVNAARGIASQVNAAVSSFASNFSTAARPQIIKSYSAGKKDESIALVNWTSKCAYFLMFVFSFPLFLQMENALTLWLKEIPAYTVLFTRLVLVEATLNSLNHSLMTLAQATGKIKLYQGLVGGILLLTFPVSYIALKCGLPPYSVMVISIFVCLVAMIVRLFIVRMLTGFSLRHFARAVVAPCFFASALSVPPPLFLFALIKNPALNFIFVVLASVVCTGLCVLFVGFNKTERNRIFAAAKEYLSKYKKEKVL